MPQLSQSGRVVTIVAVSAGDVYYALPDDTVWTAATNLTGDTPAVNVSGLVRSAANVQKLWIVDGVNSVVFDPLDSSVRLWEATVGDLPYDSDGNGPRLIQTWRGRTVVSGLFMEPQNIFASAVGDPTNWDYSPESTTPTQAFAFNNANLGQVGDVVTGLCAFSDDVLVIFCDHSIWMLRGDPLAGGQLDNVTRTIGGAFGEAFCQDPYGTIYFFSNKMGVYTLVPGSLPVRISQGIEHLLADIDTGACGILMVWDDQHQGVNLFVTELAAPAEATHYFFEWRSQAWWQVVFGNDDHNPLCVCTLDGNGPDDRVVLTGGWDGYVRALSRDNATDDGEPIASEVWIGPILTAQMDDVMLGQMQAVLARDSADVTYSVHLGRTAEEALAAAATISGTWKAGRNYNTPIDRAAHALWVKASSTGQWAIESIRVLAGPRGAVRRRAY